MAGVLSSTQSIIKMMARRSEFAKSSERTTGSSSALR